MHLGKYFDKELWKEVFHTLGQNRKRTLTTAMGVFWGMFLFVILLSANYGLRNGVKEAVGQMSMSLNGEDVESLACFVASTSLPYNGYEKHRNWYLTQSDITYLKNRIPQIVEIAPVVQANDVTTVTLQGSDYTSNATLYGVPLNRLHLDEVRVLAGRLLNRSDIENRAHVCIVGKDALYGCFSSPEEALGKQLLMNNGITLTIVGVVKTLTMCYLWD